MGRAHGIFLPIVKAIAYEEADKADFRHAGPNFTWSPNEALPELVAQRDEIVEKNTPLPWNVPQRAGPTAADRGPQGPPSTLTIDSETCRVQLDAGGGLRAQSSPVAGTWWVPRDP